MSENTEQIFQLPCKRCKEVTEVILVPTTKNKDTDKTMQCKPYGHYLGLWEDHDVSVEQKRRNVRIDRILTKYSVSDFDVHVLSKIFELRELTPDQNSELIRLESKYTQVEI